MIKRQDTHDNCSPNSPSPVKTTRRKRIFASAFPKQSLQILEKERVIAPPKSNESKTIPSPQKNAEKQQDLKQNMTKQSKISPEKPEEMEWLKRILNVDAINYLLSTERNERIEKSQEMEAALKKAVECGDLETIAQMILGFAFF